MEFLFTYRHLSTDWITSVYANIYSVSSSANQIGQSSVSSGIWCNFCGNCIDFIGNAFLHFPQNSGWKFEEFWMMLIWFTWKKKFKKNPNITKKNFLTLAIGIMSIRRNSSTHYWQANRGLWVDPRPCNQKFGLKVVTVGWQHSIDHGAQIGELNFEESVLSGVGIPCVELCEALRERFNRIHEGILNSVFEITQMGISQVRHGINFLRSSHIRAILNFSIWRILI